MSIATNSNNDNSDGLPSHFEGNIFDSAADAAAAADNPPEPEYDDDDNTNFIMDDFDTADGNNNIDGNINVDAEINNDNTIPNDDDDTPEMEIVEIDSDDDDAHDAPPATPSSPPHFNEKSEEDVLTTGRRGGKDLSTGTTTPRITTASIRTPAMTPAMGERNKRQTAVLP